MFAHTHSELLPYPQLIQDSPRMGQVFTCSVFHTHCTKQELEGCIYTGGLVLWLRLLKGLLLSVTHRGFQAAVSSSPSQLVTRCL